MTCGMKCLNGTRACGAHLRNIWAPHEHTHTTDESRFFSHDACAQCDHVVSSVRACQWGLLHVAACWALQNAITQTLHVRGDAAVDVRGNTGHVRVRASKSGNTSCGKKRNVCISRTCDCVCVCEHLQAWSTVLLCELVDIAFRGTICMLSLSSSLMGCSRVINCCVPETL